MGNLSTNMSTAPIPKMLNVGTSAVVKKCLLFSMTYNFEGVKKYYYTESLRQMQKDYKNTKELAWLWYAQELRR
jgi:hypothetical protein